MCLPLPSCVSHATFKWHFSSVLLRRTLGLVTRPCRCRSLGKVFHFTYQRATCYCQPADTLAPLPLRSSPTLHLQFRLLLNLCTLTCPVYVLCLCCCCCYCLLSLSTQICFDFNPAYALALLLHATEPAGHATGLLSLLCSDPCCLLLNTNPLMSLSLALAAHDDDYAP